MMRREDNQSQKGNAALVILLIVLVFAVGGVFYYSPQKKESEVAVQEVTKPEQIEMETQAPETDTQTTETDTESSSEDEVEGEPLPEKDTVGTEDLDFVGRYPGSVRIGYDQDKDHHRTKVTYEVKAETDKVKEYYLDLLEDEGWEIETVDDDEIRLFNEDLGTLFMKFYYYKEKATLKYILEHLPESNY